MRILYYNCPAGLSGDMNLGAMVDLGVEPAELIAELKKLGLDGWKLKFTRDERKGITGTRCDVLLSDAGEASHHAHDHHHHGDHHHGAHVHHPHGDDPHHHHHRSFGDIRELIEKSTLGERVKNWSIKVFRALAEAEGKVHGKEPEKVHFHEVGAVDSIVDMVGAAICWDLLKIDQVAASTIELGSGTVQCAHGKMPVPAPATARLVEGFPVSLGGVGYEATTPTGAALLAGMNCRFEGNFQGKSIATGVGIGQKDDSLAANVVYVTLLDCGEETSEQGDAVLELSTNLDDMSPERIAYLAELLLDKGALDVWQVPATFKKSRQGCVLSALVRPEDRILMADLIFRHSTTLGIRWKSWNRAILGREISDKQTPLGKVRVKSALQGDRVLRSKIEFEDLKELARRHDLPISEIEHNISKNHV